MEIDFASLIVPVVRRLCGNPNEDLSTKEEMRWGNKGSLSVKVKQGIWYDHETKEGGGCLDFIRRHSGEGDPLDWLRKERLIENDTLIAIFDYRDETNKLLYQVCRNASKKFWQRRPNGDGSWINKVKDVRHVLYRLPELLASTDTVLLPEGEKHVDALIKLGLCATCNAGGAGKWRKEYNECLRGRDVVVLPDNDTAGQDHSENIARNLTGIAGRVRVLMLPNLKPKGDVINWLDAGGTKAELLRLAEETATWEETRSGSPEDGGHHEQRDLPQAAVLVRLAEEAELFHTPEGKTFADIQNDGHRETWSVRSKSFKLWLGRAFFQLAGKTPRREAISSALDQIEAHAIWDGPERQIYVRIGGLNGKIYLDLCDKEWRAIEVDANGWRIVAHSPVRFRRAPGMLPLPVPVSGGSVDDLRAFLNLHKNDDDDEADDFVLVVAWALAVLRDRGPYPVLVLSGEQGSAKTFFCSCMRALLDPNTAPNRTLSREERDLFIAANNGHLIAFDNVSSMPAWISDALCRLSTGGGFATRQLYTDDEETLFTAMRPVILNGIEDTVTRPDLADRAIILTLEPILDSERRSEQELLAEFEAARPKILGALLDAVATGLKMLPETKLDQVPRMADFVFWVTACESALWEKGTFETAYTANRDNLVEAVLEANPVAGAIRDFLSAQQGRKWSGTATALLNELNFLDSARGVKRERKYWPQIANQLSGKLRRIAPMLRKSGIEVVFQKSGDRLIEFNPDQDAPGQGQPYPP
jgi:hypothetical protein